MVFAMMINLYGTLVKEMESLIHLTGMGMELILTVMDGKVVHGKIMATLFLIWTTI